MRHLYKPKFIRAPEPDWSAYEQEDANARRRLLHADLLVDAVVAEMAGDVAIEGACLPWPKTWQSLRFRPGEVSLWMGYNGHKKSMMLGQVAVSLSAQMHRVVIASFEMAPHRSLARMVRQALRGEASAAGIRQACHDLLVWFYDQVGDATPAQCYALIRYAATLGVDHVIIDPLLKIVRGTDDYTGQKDFIAQLCALAREYEMHIHLVHHARKGSKGSDEDEPPRKLDARGAGEITDQVDNVLVVWWDKRKQDKRDSGAMIDVKTPDALLICEKQRNGSWESAVRLWFDPKSLQFCQDANVDALDLMCWHGPKSGRAAAREPGEDEREKAA